jgi:hypothetical protein
MNDDVALQGNCYREERAVTLRNRAKLNANTDGVVPGLYRAQCDLSIWTACAFSKSAAAYLH